MITGLTDSSFLTEHLPALGLAAVALWWIASRVIQTRNAAKQFVAHIVDERMPKAIKDALHNGIRDMVTTLNAEQDRRWSDSMHTAFREHEERENASVTKAIESARKDACGDLRDDFDDIEGKLKEIEERLEEIEGVLERKRGDA